MKRTRGVLALSLVVGCISYAAIIVSPDPPGASGTESLKFGLLPGLQTSGTTIEGATDYTHFRLNILGEDDEGNPLALIVQGQRVEAQNGTFPTAILESLPGAYYTKIRFNIDVLGTGYVVFTTSPDPVVDPNIYPAGELGVNKFQVGNGRNFFEIYATGAQTLHTVTMNVTGASIQSVGSVHLGGLADVPPTAVPEPGSVGLALCGAAALLGIGVRRRRD